MVWAVTLFPHPLFAYQAKRLAAADIQRYAVHRLDNPLSYVKLGF